MLEIGTTAPEFNLLDQNETECTLSESNGQWRLVYFYPKDDTPGCTKEACTITEVYDDFEKMNVKVIGISKDSPASHQKFAEKYELPFTLLSDESTETIQAYGAWQEKSMYGKKYLGIARVSYLIDPEGMVARVYPKVSPEKHALEVLADVRELIA